MKDVYEKPVSPEMDRALLLHYRVKSVAPDPSDAAHFIAKFEVLNDEDGKFYPFEIILPRDIDVTGDYWKPVFESVGLFYSRREDILTYGYRIVQFIFDEIFKQTKEAPPKKAASKKSEGEEGGDQPKEENAETAAD